MIISINKFIQKRKINIRYRSCKHLLDQTNFFDGPADGHVYCKGCYRSVGSGGMEVNQTAKSMVDTAAIRSRVLRSSYQSSLSSLGDLFRLFLLMSP